MPKITKHCAGCEKETKQEFIGLIPVKSIKQIEAQSWIKASVCTSCSAVNEIEVTEDEIISAEERYIDTLLKLGLIEEEKADSLLNN